MISRSSVIGLVIRLSIATLLALGVWWLAVTPFNRIPLSREATSLIVRVVDFPVALAGDLLAPIRGMELVFNDHGPWCDFCPPGETFRLQMRLAIPVYLVLLYLPKLLRTIRRRDARRFNRILIFLTVYAVFTAAFFLATGDRHDRSDLRMAAMWLVILSAAAAAAWSHLAPRLKAAAIAAVLLAGAWAMPYVMTFDVPKMDEVRPYYVSYLVLLIFGVGGTLSVTWVIEWGMDTFRRRWPLP